MSTRVLIADDSGLMRRVIGSSLREQGFEIVGEAADGDEALKLWASERPDCMTLDLAMPGRDGMAVLRELRATTGAGIPVIVVSAFSPAHGARAVDALAEGAFDLVSKPGIGESLEAFSIALGEKVTAAARARRGVRSRITPPAPRRPEHVAAPSVPPAASAAPVRTGRPRVVVIASSTGGPRALAELLPTLPNPLGAGGYVVQHMPQGFTRSLAERLDGQCKLHIAEAEGGEELDPGTLLIAPGGKHLRLTSRCTRLTEEPPVGALRPRADLTIEDAAKLYGNRLLLVVLTGMGRDGEAGARAVKAAGGRVLAEAEETCTVYGMPRAVVEANLADRVLPLHQLGAAIAEEAWC